MADPSTNPDDEDDIPAGEVIAGTPYRVLGKLGAGGHGAIFAAEHVKVGGRCAIKILHRRYANDPEYVERLRQESRFIERIGRNPNIVMILDAGFARDGRCYQVMEHLEGRTLGDLIVINKFLTVRRSCEIVLELLAALGAAHAHGIVHRDVKPSNIFVTYDGVAKLLDFGVSKALYHVDGKPITLKGLLPGTPSYMAPEYIQHAVVSPLIDVFAAGVVLWECLTGQPPFSKQDHAHETMRTIVDRGLPSLESMGFGWLPAPLRAAVERATARRPADRYQSADAFAHAVRRALDLLGEAPKPVRRSSPSLADAAPRRSAPPPPAAPREAAPRRGSSRPPEPTPGANGETGEACEEEETEALPATAPEWKRPAAARGAPVAAPIGDAHIARQSVGEETPGAAGEAAPGAPVAAPPGDGATPVTWMSPGLTAPSPEPPATSFNPALSARLSQVDPLGPTELTESPTAGPTLVSGAVGLAPEAYASGAQEGEESVDGGAGWVLEGDPTQQTSSPFLDADATDMTPAPALEPEGGAYAPEDARGVLEAAPLAGGAGVVDAGEAAPTRLNAGPLETAAQRASARPKNDEGSGSYDFVDYEITDEGLLLEEPLADPGVRPVAASPRPSAAAEDVAAARGRSEGRDRPSPPEGGGHRRAFEAGEAGEAHAPSSPDAASDDEGEAPSGPVSVRELPADSVPARPHSPFRDVPTMMESRPSLTPEATSSPAPATAGGPPERTRPSPAELVRHAHRARPAAFVLGTAALSFVLGSALVGSLVYVALRPSAASPPAASSAAMAAPLAPGALSAPAAASSAPPPASVPAQAPSGRR